jgi:uncharacterized protein YneF (UPF0154 family)
MIDQMSMPVLFVLMFVLLLLAGGCMFVAVRVVGARLRSAPSPTEPDALLRRRV